MKKAIEQANLKASSLIVGYIAKQLPKMLSRVGK